MLVSEKPGIMRDWSDWAMSSLLLVKSVRMWVRRS